MTETFLKFGSHLMMKQGNGANCANSFKNFVEMARKHSLVRVSTLLNTIANF